MADYMSQSHSVYQIVYVRALDYDASLDRVFSEIIYGVHPLVWDAKEKDCKENATSYRLLSWQKLTDEDIKALCLVKEKKIWPTQS